VNGDRNRIRIHSWLLLEVGARKRVTRQIITENLDPYFSMKGGTLMSKIDFAHTTHINASDQVIVAELPFSMNVPVICQIMLFFLKNIEMPGSFP
jgi:hypothetical protein